MLDKVDPLPPWASEMLQVCLNHGLRMRRNHIGSQDITNSRQTFSWLINNFTHDIKSMCAHSSPQMRNLEAHFQSIFHYAVAGDVLWFFRKLVGKLFSLSSLLL